MTLFQVLVGSSLGVLAAADFLRWMRGREPSRLLAARFVAWTLGALAVAEPQWVTAAAQLFGVQRGADLVLYVLALAFLGACFYFYARYVRLQRQLTEIVRHVAVREAVRGADATGLADETP